MYTLNDEEFIDYGAPPTDKELQAGVEMVPPFGYSLIEGEPSSLVLEKGFLVLDRFSPMGKDIFDNWFRFVLPGNLSVENASFERLPIGRAEEVNKPDKLTEFLHIRRNLTFRKLRELAEVGGCALMFETIEGQDEVVMYNSIWFQDEADSVQVILRFNPLERRTIYDAAEHMGELP